MDERRKRSEPSANGRKPYQAPRIAPLDEDARLPYEAPHLLKKRSLARATLFSAMGPAMTAMTMMG